MENFSLTNQRTFTPIEKQMIWKKPTSHQTSAEELRIATEIKANWLDPEMKISNVLLEAGCRFWENAISKSFVF